MGNYYRGISKRAATVDGTPVLFSNFFGKAPSPFSSAPCRTWEAFLTRSDNTARKLRETNEYDYVVNVQEKSQLEGATVAVYKGQAVMDDGFWDKQTIGTIVRKNGKLAIKLNQPEA